MHITTRIANDLAESGLSAEDMNIRPIDAATQSACKLSAPDGYIIPYYNIEGTLLKFFRIKVFNSKIKYRQLKNTGNHVYFPQEFAERVKSSKVLIITEGEKKAAAASKAGFLCVAFGGVDSWRNKILQLPEDTEFVTSADGRINAKLPSDVSNRIGVTLGPVAGGFDDLVNAIRRYDLQVCILYDRDDDVGEHGLKFEVQRAASELGLELRARGISFDRIKQLSLPKLADLAAEYSYVCKKCGLDDFLVNCGIEPLQELITPEKLEALYFPPHPDVKTRVDYMLSLPKLPREDLRRLSLYVLTDLDARGKRMYNADENQYYYFHKESNRLLRVGMGTVSGERQALTEFGQFLYRQYGISPSADAKLTSWLNTVFTAESPVIPAKPYKVLARKTPFEDVVRVQLGDSYYAELNADVPDVLQIHRNGHNHILFEAGGTKELDIKKLQAEFVRQSELPLKSLWAKVFETVRMRQDTRAAELHALLYYVSPWLYRWRGMQLPIEIITGEAGSGKSTLYELRLRILTGIPKLRNSPETVKDWQASITSSGGLHVTDNIQFTEKQFRQRLSDELCRLVTDPNPQIEMRELYSNNSLLEIPVNTVFGFTGITNPFTASDVLQRSTIIELDKFVAMTDKKLSYDSMWKERQFDDFGGREGWLAHHMVVLNAFFKEVRKSWDSSYKAHSRLVHLEQCLSMIGNVFGNNTTWIGPYLAESSTAVTVSNDWALEGLQEFSRVLKRVYEDEEFSQEVSKKIGISQIQIEQKLFTATDMSNWALSTNAYMDCSVLSKARALGRYLSKNKALVAQTCNLFEYDKMLNNRRAYRFTG